MAGAGHPTPIQTRGYETQEPKAMATELYQLRVAGMHQQEYNECVFYIQGDNLSAGDVIVNAKDLLDSWETNVKGSWLPMLPPTYYLDRVTAKRQDSSAGGVEVVLQYDNNTETGTAGGPAQATQLCPIVRLIPPMGVKSAGRFFLPAIYSGDINNGAPTASWITRLANLMSAWLLNNFGVGSIQWQLAIYSRKLDQFHLAQDFDTSPIVGWQKRRQRPF